MGMLGTYTESDAKLIRELVDDRSSRLRIFAEDISIKMRQSQIEVWVPTQEINKQFRGSYELIPAKARIVNEKFTYNGRVEIDCVVACGHWHKLGNLQQGTINIFKHLDKLLPQNRRCIGCFTFQNGIQNTIDDFKEMGEKITENLRPEKPLCIGLYNKTNGIVLGLGNDLERLLDTWGLNVNSVLFMRQMLLTFAEVLPLINPNLYFTHIAHSEGGLIAKAALTNKEYGLEPQKARFIKEHLITATYGAVAPIPDEVVLRALNTYSKDDVTMLFAKKHLDKTPGPDISFKDDQFKELAQEIFNKMYNKSKTVDEIYKELKRGSDQFYEKYYITRYPYICTKDGYTLKIVDSLTPKNKQPLVEKDHAFLGDTYQAALRSDIKALRDGKMGGIYEGY